MEPMRLPLEWSDVALRLALTVVAGVVIGYNRTEHGKVAGLRTTLLVCLAASVAMIQANVLLATTGAAADSFVKVDVMRLPLGILSGMGFIGGGVILRRDTLVIGVTTAATLWFVTVAGLCFGGGQIVLGIAAVAVAYLALSALGFVEYRIERERQTDLTLVVAPDGPSEDTIRSRLEQAGLHVKVCQVVVSR